MNDARDCKKSAECYLFVLFYLKLEKCEQKCEQNANTVFNARLTAVTRAT